MHSEELSTGKLNRIEKNVGCTGQLRRLTKTDQKRTEYSYICEKSRIDI